jgi:SAM-dependent methyltransferase
MNHADHVALLRNGIPHPGGTWADFGSGTGAFTLALAELIGPNGQIYSIDKKRGALRQQEQALRRRFPDCPVTYITADYTRRLDLPLLDGVVMANALHFQRRKAGVVQLIYDYLRPGGRLILVEYNVDRGNHWVPHPLSYPTWEKVARRHGFVQTQLLAARPSRFLREIYAAVSHKPARSGGGPR